MKGQQRVSQCGSENSKWSKILEEVDSG